MIIKVNSNFTPNSRLIGEVKDDVLFMNGEYYNNYSIYPPVKMTINIDLTKRVNSLPLTFDNEDDGYYYLQEGVDQLADILNIMNPSGKVLFISDDYMDEFESDMIDYSYKMTEIDESIYDLIIVINDITKINDLNKCNCPILFITDDKLDNNEFNINVNNWKVYV